MAKNKGILSSVTAAIVGAAVGASAVVLSDKKKRQAIVKKADELVREGEEKLEEGMKMVEGAMGKKAKKRTKAKRKTKTGK